MKSAIVGKEEKIQKVKLPISCQQVHTLNNKITVWKAKAKISESPALWVFTESKIYRVIFWQYKWGKKLKLESALSCSLLFYIVHMSFIHTRPCASDIKESKTGQSTKKTLKNSGIHNIGNY